MLATQMRLFYWRHILKLRVYIGEHTIWRTRWQVLIDTTNGEIHIGKECIINAAVMRGPITIGHRVLVNIDCDLTGHAGGPITIGNDVMLAPRVVILGGMHQYRDRERTIREQGTFAAPVQIEDDVWIGTNAVITPGVHIGKGAVIGANAVVTGDVESYSIVGGVPARKIGVRESAASSR